MAEFVTTKENWHRSSYSEAHTQCLEAHCRSGVLVRDSRRLEEAVLAFSAAAWKELLSGVHRR